MWPHTWWIQEARLSQLSRYRRGQEIISTVRVWAWTREKKSSRPFHLRLTLIIHSLNSMLGEETTYEIIKSSSLSVKLLHRPPCSDTIGHVGSGRVRQQHWSGGTPKSTNYFPACFTVLSSLLDLKTLQTTRVRACAWNSKWENKSERDGGGLWRQEIKYIHPDGPESNRKQFRVKPGAQNTIFCALETSFG